MSRRDIRLKGLNPSAYIGVNPEAAPNIIQNNRRPLPHDTQFNIGDLWIDSSVLDIWMLVSLDKGQATWIRYATALNSAVTFVTDSGSAQAVLSIIEMAGSSIIDSTAAVDRVTAKLINGPDGYTYIGDNTTMAAGRIYCGDGTLLVTYGPNSINIVNTGAGTTAGIKDTTGGTANAVAGVIKVLGTTNISTAGATNVVTLTLGPAVSIPGTLTLSAMGAGVVFADAVGLLSSSNGSDGQVIIGGGTVPLWANLLPKNTSISITNTANTVDIKSTVTDGILKISGNTGQAIGIANNIQILNGTNTTSVALGHTVTVSLNNSVTLSGTLTISPLTAGVVRSTSGLLSSSNGADGQTLIGGGTNAAWANLVPLDSTLSITNGANSIDIKQITSGSANVITQLKAQTGVAVWDGSININIVGGTNMVTNAPGGGSPQEVIINTKDNISLSGILSTNLALGVVMSSAAGLLSISNGLDGQILIGGGTVPLWRNITSTGGTIKVTNTASHIDLIDLQQSSLIANSGFLSTQVNVDAITNPIRTSGWWYLSNNGTSTYVLYDPGSHVSLVSGRSTYTAPLTGKYSLQCGYTLTTYFTYYYPCASAIQLVTSNRTYNLYKFEPLSVQTVPGSDPQLNAGMTCDVVADLDTGDTVQFAFYVDGLGLYPRGWGINGGWGVEGNNTYFSGFYIGA